MLFFYLSKQAYHEELCRLEHAVNPYTSMHAQIKNNGAISPNFDNEVTEEPPSTTTVATTTTADERDHSRDNFLHKSKYAAAMMDMMETDDFDASDPKEDRQYESSVLDTTGIVTPDNLTISDNLICCYSDPLDPKNRIGRPFIMTDYIKEHWTKYMNHKPLDNSKKKDVTVRLKQDFSKSISKVKQ